MNTIEKRGIVNTFEQMVAARQSGLPDVWIQLDTHMGTRSTFVTGWRVCQYGVNLDPTVKRHWSDNHTGKCFREDALEGTLKERRAACLGQAKRWAQERFGVTEWKRNRQRDYVDARVDKQFPLRKSKP